MHRIDTSTANEGLFTQGSPAFGVPPTQLSAAWCNDIQETLAAVVETAELTLEKGDYQQLVDALRVLIQGQDSQIMLMGHDFKCPAGATLTTLAGEIQVDGANESRDMVATVPLPVGCKITGVTMVMRRYALQGLCAIGLEEQSYSPLAAGTVTNSQIVVDGSNTTLGLQIIAATGPISHVAAANKPLLATATLTNGATDPSNGLVAVFISYQPTAPGF